MINRFIMALLHMMGVLWCAVTLVFVLLRVLPGDPISAQVFQSGGTQSQADQQRAELGLADPIHEQYIRYWGDLLQGDLGDSLLYYQPVTALIGERLLPTVSLTFGAMSVAMTVGCGMGLMAVIDRPQVIGWLGQGFITLSLAIPLYLTAIIAIYWFSVRWDVLPVFGSDTPAHLILPASVLGFHTGGSIAQVLRANLMEVWQQPFMLTVNAKGMPWSVKFDHTVRLAILPVIGVIGVQAGFLLSGTVVIEFIFGRQGLGTLLYQAVQGHDYPLVQGLTLLGAFFYLGANGLSAMARYLLDPRLREER